MKLLASNTYESTNIRPNDLQDNTRSLLLETLICLGKNDIKEISGIRGGVAEVFDLPGCYVVSVGSSLPTFRETYRSDLQD
jgi:hypothetical protein